jgi:hypothetical protein
VLGMHADGLSYRLIARNVGLSKNTLMDIVSGITASAEPCRPACCVPVTGPTGWTSAALTVHLDHLPIWLVVSSKGARQRHWHRQGGAGDAGSQSGSVS